MKALVTGGAGYVGSHLVMLLADQGHSVTVLDDLRQGHRAALPPDVRLVVDSIGNPTVEPLLAEGWDAVFHFAALSLVGESMAQPMRYFLENAGAGLRLIDGCVRHGVKRFVLSSTANVFGKPVRVPIDEDAALAPSSPYGESKLILERALFWAQRQGLRSACLRYFNAAGADPAGHLGEDHRPETHLIPLVIDAALGRRGPLDARIERGNQDTADEPGPSRHNQHVLIPSVINRGHERPKKKAGLSPAFSRLSESSTSDIRIPAHPEAPDGRRADRAVRSASASGRHPERPPERSPGTRWLPGDASRNR